MTESVTATVTVTVTVTVAVSVSAGVSNPPGAVLGGHLRPPAGRKVPVRLRSGPARAEPAHAGRARHIRSGCEYLLADMFIAPGAFIFK